MGLCWILERTTNTRVILSATCHKKGDQAIMLSRSSKEVAGVTLLTWAIDTRNDFSDKGIKYALEQIIKNSENGTPFVTGTQSPRGGSPTESFVCREVQFNAFCPAHFTFCYGDLSNPWQHGETATRVFEYYTRLHNELIPYIYGAAIHAHRTGEPIIKRTTGDLQYTFGEDMLVAPIYRDELTRRVSFPPGEWIDYWDEGKLYHGGQQIDYQAPLDHSPLFLRAGAMIPMEVRENWTGHGTEKSAHALTIQIYPADEHKAWFYEVGGDTLLHCTKHADYLTPGDVRVELDGPPRNYVLRLKTFRCPRSVHSREGDDLPERGSLAETSPYSASWSYDGQTGMTNVFLFNVDSSSVMIKMDLHGRQR